VSKVSNAAAELGRQGGSRQSPAKAAASRMNGAKGGRPVRTKSFGAPGGVQVEVHADARHIGYTVAGRAAFVARTGAAARWLKRHGFVYSSWQLAESVDVPEDWNGRCWA
jgi:hypothetical protein